MMSSENPYQSPAEATDAFAPVANQPLELGGRFTRWLAQIVDTIILMAIMMPVMIFTGYFERSMQQQVTIPEVVLYTVLGMVLYLVLHGYLLATRGQSIGKLLLSIRIVDYDTDEILPLV